MQPEEIEQLYDESYVRDYERKFLHAEITRQDCAHEVELIRSLLTPNSRWLDVACGTGYYLSRFPEISRAGLDASHAMLEKARAVNPNGSFHHGSFLDAHGEWNDQWDLVSCMWYSYGLVDSMRQVEQLFANLASWTAPTGRLFLPLADPRLITLMDIPYRLSGPWPGEVTVTGIIWSYSEHDGTKVHRHQVAPHIEVVQHLLGAFFEKLEILTYPPALPDWGVGRQALVASQKKSMRKGD